MRKHFLSYLFLPLLVFLSACGGTLSIALETTPTPGAFSNATVEALQTRIATLQPRKIELDMQSGSDTIRQALLVSHKNWRTLWLDGQMIASPSQAGSENQRVQMWVDRAEARFRVLTGPLEGAPQTLQVSDGVTQARTSLENGATQAQPLMDGARDLNWQAPPLDQGAAGIVPHPLDLEIDSPLGEMAFPAALAQQGGTFTPTGMEKLADRVALIVEQWDAAQLRARLWVDSETGILLRWDQYGKDGLSATPDTSITINALALDVQLPVELFNLQLKEKPQFALNASGAANPTPQPPDAVFGEGEGELYFVVDRAPEDLQLARLPESCVDGSEPCPAPQVVEGFPNKNNTIEPLIWSPGGRLAALVQQGQLFRFIPDRNDWQALAQYPILLEDVAWSADADRLVFIGQDGNDRQDIYTVGPDGTGLQNLTNGLFQGAGSSLWVEGFLADGRLLFEVIEGTSAQPHALRLQAGAEPAPVAGLRLQHGILALAPDRQQIAFSNDQDGAAALNVTGLDLTGEGVSLKDEPRRLATFQQAAIQQILWSAGGETAAGTHPAGSANAPALAEQWIAFNVSSGGAEDTVNTVYVIRPDGTDLRQLFQSRDIHQLIFAGDGRFLIAAFADNRQPSVIPINGGAARPLEVPGVLLNQRILGLSWRGR